jgi:hypothetical protein
VVASGDGDTTALEPPEARLAALGWSIRVKATSGPFYWGEGALA